MNKNVSKMGMQMCSLSERGSEHICVTIGPTIQYWATSGTSDLAQLEGKNQALELESPGTRSGSMPLSLVDMNQQCRNCKSSDTTNYPSLGSKA